MFQRISSNMQIDSSGILVVKSQVTETYSKETLTQQIARLKEDANKMYQNYSYWYGQYQELSKEIDHLNRCLNFLNDEPTSSLELEESLNDSLGGTDGQSD